MRTKIFHVHVGKKKKIRQKHTSLRTMLHSDWSRRMFITVPHSPPEMFWQLSAKAIHPASRDVRADPIPSAVNLT